jgi:hypothetical protein
MTTWSAETNMASEPSCGCQTARRSSRGPQIEGGSCGTCGPKSGVRTSADVEVGRSVVIPPLSQNTRPEVLPVASHLLSISPTTVDHLAFAQSLDAGSAGCWYAPTRGLDPGPGTNVAAWQERDDPICLGPGEEGALFQGYPSREWMGPSASGLWPTR